MGGCYLKLVGVFGGRRISEVRNPALKYCGCLAAEISAHLWLPLPADGDLGSHKSSLSNNWVPATHVETSILLWPWPLQTQMVQNPRQPCKCRCLKTGF